MHIAEHFFSRKARIYISGEKSFYHVQQVIFAFKITIKIMIFIIFILDAAAETVHGAECIGR
jgi:hypothetical protein